MVVRHELLVDEDERNGHRPVAGDDKQHLGLKHLTEKPGDHLDWGVLGSFLSCLTWTAFISLMQLWVFKHININMYYTLQPAASVINCKVSLQKLLIIHDSTALISYKIQQHVRANMCFRDTDLQSLWTKGYRSTNINSISAGHKQAVITPTVTSMVKNNNQSLLIGNCPSLPLY